jgi:EAL domain-containing protein (putative c-di-GMP-specific phosphodiesterase class I)
MQHFAEDADIRLVAEGVETDAELATLRDLDIELSQGYLLGPPRPVGAMGLRVRAQRSVSRPVSDGSRLA